MLHICLILPISSKSDLRAGITLCARTSRYITLSVNYFLLWLLGDDCMVSCLTQYNISDIYSCEESRIHCRTFSRVIIIYFRRNIQYMVHGFIGYYYYRCYLVTTVEN